MCRLLQVARAGFCQWPHRPESDLAKEDARLPVLIRDSRRASGKVYGSRREPGDLREIGEACGKHRVARIMRQHGIKAQRGYKAPRPIVGHPSLLAPNHLNREFTTSQPDQTWVTDMTCIRTWQGWLCLAVVIDLFSRKVVGWSIKPRIGVGCAADGTVAAQTHWSRAGPFRSGLTIWR